MKEPLRLRIDININASQEETWDVLYDHFGESSKFNPGIIGSYDCSDIEGKKRVCMIGNSREITERITDVRPMEFFRIEVIEGSLPLMGEISAAWLLKPLNEHRTRVCMEFCFCTRPRFLGALIQFPMRKKFEDMMVGLKYYLETGDLVSPENIKDIRKAYHELPAGASFHPLHQKPIAA